MHKAMWTHTCGGGSGGGGGGRCLLLLRPGLHLLFQPHSRLAQLLSHQSDDTGLPIQLCVELADNVVPCRVLLGMSGEKVVDLVLQQSIGLF